MHFPKLPSPDKSEPVHKDKSDNTRRPNQPDISQEEKVRQGEALARLAIEKLQASPRADAVFVPVGNTHQDVIKGLKEGFYQSDPRWKDKIHLVRDVEKDENGSEIGVQWLLRFKRI